MERMERSEAPFGTRNSEPGTCRWGIILDRDGQSGAQNMALDQALVDLAERTGTGVLRLYRWAPFCLSFGRHEPALRRYDRAAIVRRGLDTVRRPTGGRAVWHARELTYAVAAPVTWFGSLSASYHQIHTLLARAIRALGAPAELAPATPAVGLAGGACFARTAGGEVMVRGRKLVGSAQLRQGPALLQHGSLLLEDDQALVGELTAGTTLPAGGEVTLREAAGRPIDFDEAAAAVAAAFATIGGDWASADGQAISQLATPHLARFRDPGWTWRR
jgi:lipoyl(octanoyl) transferase